MHPFMASLALAGAISAVAFAVAPYREPVQFVEQTVNRPTKDQSRLPQGPLVPRFVKTESYRLSAMPLPKPKPKHRHARR
jgi:hypothetical protein